MKLIDHAAARVGAQACRDAGYDGAIRYLANSPDRNLPNKILTPDEAAGYVERGMPLVSCFQQNKADAEGGFDLGVRHARAAQARHEECHGPAGRPIYFTPLDRDPTRDEWVRLCRPYLDGASSVLGKDRVGVYGGQRAMWWAAEDGCRWRWQTKAWSRYDANGNWQGTKIPVQWVDGVQIRQERVDQDQINGIGIDVNTTWAEDFGQWSKKSGENTVTTELERIEKMRGQWFGDPVWLVDVWRLWGLQVDLIGDPDPFQHGHGDFVEVVGVMGHHTAGGGVNDWRIVKWGRPGLGGPLSQAVLEKDGTIKFVAVGVSWHAGSGRGSAWADKFTTDANWRVVGVEAVSSGVERNGHYDWTDVQLRSYKVMTAAVLWFLRKPAEWFCGHLEYNLVDGKIDPAGINLRDFRREVQTLIDGGPMAMTPGGGSDQTGPPTPPPVLPEGPTGIETVREANPWLGNRVMNERELPCPDGRGRYAHYEQGSIYFHPDTGIHPVPKGGVYEFWSGVGWETSWLGYPTEDPHMDDEQQLSLLPSGQWQQFQGGRIYHKRGDEHGWPVFGGIGEAWIASGAETGPYGWPQSRERPIDANRVAQDFEGGQIVWFHAPGVVGTLDRGDRDELK